MTRAVLLVLAAALLAAPAAGTAAAPPRPTQQDRAQAKAIVAAAKALGRSVDRATDAYAESLFARLSGCAAWGELEPEEAIAALERLGDVLAADLARVLVQPTRAYSAALGRIRPRDRALRAGHALVAALVRRDLAAGGERLPVVDVCRVVTRWAQAGWDEGFDLLAAAGVDRALLAAVVRERPLTAAQRRTLTAFANRLVACGVPRADAALFRP